MTVISSLKALSAYPIPTALIEDALAGAGLLPDEEADSAMRGSKAYKSAKAKVFFFLATAPNVSQGGISYSFTSADKTMFRKMAQALMDEIGEEDGSRVEYGYQGETF